MFRRNVQKCWIQLKTFIFNDSQQKHKKALRSSVQKYLSIFYSCLFKASAFSLNRVNRQWGLNRSPVLGDKNRLVFFHSYIYFMDRIDFAELRMLLDIKFLLISRTKMKILSHESTIELWFSSNVCFLWMKLEIVRCCLHGSGNIDFAWFSYSLLRCFPLSLTLPFECI